MTNEPTNAAKRRAPEASLGDSGRGGGIAGAGSDPLLDAGHANEAGEAARLAIDLSGTMPCVRCGYDLRGLSITASCPECGTSVRATLVRVIDPEGQTTAQLRMPHGASWAVVAWAATGSLASLCMLALHVMHEVQVGMWAMRDGVAMLTLGLVFASSAGPLFLVRLFVGKDRVARQGLALLAWFLTLILAGGLMEPLLERTGWSYARSSWVETRVVWGMFVVGILLCMRPTVRVLAARGWVQQQMHKDRQTTVSLALVVGLGTLAIVGVALSPLSHDAILARLMSQTIVILTLLLLSLGLGRLAYELWRMRGRIAAGLAPAASVVPRQTAGGGGKGNGERGAGGGGR